MDGIVAKRTLMGASVLQSWGLDVGGDGGRGKSASGLRSAATGETMENEAVK